MNDAPTQGAEASAGAQLRAARERQGLHVAALAAAIKIPQRKLESLEADRLDELPDATFARALALTVCRALKIDPSPVLAQLPQAGGGHALADVAGGLNAPFRERPGRAEGTEFNPLRHPLSWGALLVLAAAAAVLLLPTGWWQGWWPGTGSTQEPVPEPIASAPEAAASAAAVAPAADPAMQQAAAVGEGAASTAAVEVLRSASAPDVAGSAAAGVPAVVAVLRATEASWVEVVDASGRVLVQRVLQPGEMLGLDGRLPFKLKIGNAAGMQLQLRGQPVDLGPVTRDNVARLELN
jgi:cytoskeleton protein RodZ